MSNYLEAQVFTHIFRTSNYTKPSTIAIALLTAPASDTSTGANITEVANSNNYSRKVFNPGDANWAVSGGQVTNSAVIEFDAASGNWGTITDIALVDNATYGQGNVLLYGTLTTQKAINNGDILRFPISGITFNLD